MTGKGAGMGGAAASGLGALARMAVRFGVVGLASIAVYFAILFALRPVISAVAVLAFVAYIGSMAFNYVAQSRFTFGADARDRGAMARYVTMHLGCMAFNSGAMHLLVEVMGMGLWTAQAMVTLCVAGSSFLLSRFWVYRAT